MSRTANHGGICISVAVPDTDKAIAAVSPVQQDADVIEIRLDAMHTYDIRRLCVEITRPVLFTNRPIWEGGHFEGPEEKRLAPLLEAIEQGAAFVDLELKTEFRYRQQVVEALRGSGTRLIISHHDFDQTPKPAGLTALLQRQVESGAHIGKIVTMAHSHVDILRMLTLLAEARENNFPLIAFCMGAAGRLSRIITPLLGGFLTYAALDEHQATAPGQLAVRELKEKMALLTD